MEEVLSHRLNQIGADAEAFRLKGKAELSIDTSSKRILPPIAPINSPIPNFRYRREKKAAVAFAHLRKKLNETNQDDDNHSDDEVSLEIVLEDEPKATTRTSSAVSSKHTVKSSTILNEDDFVKNLLEEAG